MVSAEGRKTWIWENVIRGGIPVGGDGTISQYFLHSLMELAQMNICLWFIGHLGQNGLV